MESTPTPPSETPAPASAEPAPPVDTRISIDDFMKVELKVGKIIAAEPVPKSRKLLGIQIDTGDGERQVVAGIAGAYEPEALVGRTVIFVANLQPAKLMGVESNGMILAATGPDGRPVLLTVEDVEAAPPGSGVR